MAPNTDADAIIDPNMNACNFGTPGFVSTRASFFAEVVFEIAIENNLIDILINSNKRLNG